MRFDDDDDDDDRKAIIDALVSGLVGAWRSSDASKATHTIQII